MGSEPGHDEAADDRPWPRLPLGAAYVWLLFVAYELSSGLVLDAESTCDLAQLLAVESRPGEFRDWLENFLLGGPAGLLFAFYYAPRALGLKGYCGEWQYPLWSRRWAWEMAQCWMPARTPSLWALCCWWRVPPAAAGSAG